VKRGVSEYRIVEFNAFAMLIVAIRQSKSPADITFPIPEVAEIDKMKHDLKKAKLD